MNPETFAESPLGHLVEIRGMDGRRRREYRHVAFVAEPLGAEPALTSQSWHAITAAHRALAKLDAAASLIPNPRLLRRPTLSREAQSTSALEGTFAPLEDVLAADLGAPERSTDLGEVINYLNAAEDAFAQLSLQEGRITVGLLAEAQRTLVRGTGSDTSDAGRLRACQVAIGSPSGDFEDSRFVPMPPGDGLQSAALELTDWINDRSGKSVDAMVGAAMAHYQFETVHPFNDGNGRIGRLLVVLQFMSSGLLSEPLLSVSPWFEARRGQYQDLLAGVSATGNWDEWIQFFAQGIAASAEDTGQRIDRLLAIQRMYVAHLTANRLTGVIRDICELIIGSPIVTVPDLAKRVDMTTQAVNNAVMRLVKDGILTGPIGTYNRRFYAWDVIEAISSQMGSVPTSEEPLHRERPAYTPEDETADEGDSLLEEDFGAVDGD